MAPQRNAKRASRDRDNDKRDRTNYGKTGAVETVLIETLGPSMLHFQGSMTTSKDERFDHCLPNFKSALHKKLAELIKQRDRLIEDGAPDSLVAGETKKIEEMEAFIKNALPGYTAKQLQLQLLTMSKMVKSKRQDYQKKGETGRPTQDNDWHLAWVKHFGAHAVWGFQDVSQDTMERPAAREAAAGVAAAAAAAAGSSEDDEEEEESEDEDDDYTDGAAAAAAAAASSERQESRPGLQSLLGAVEQTGGSSSGSSKKKKATKKRKPDSDDSDQSDRRPSKYSEKLNYKAGVFLEGLGSIMKERDMQLAQLLGQHAANTSANYREIGRGFAEGMAALFGSGMFGMFGGAGMGGGMGGMGGGMGRGGNGREGECTQERLPFSSQRGWIS